MELWLLRHAEPEERSASGRDEDRQLTPAGLAQARAIGRGIAAVTKAIRLILTSPYLRAHQTAEAVSKALGAPMRTSRALEPDRDPEAVLSEIDHAAEESILLVGHAPLLGHLLGRLITGDPGADVPLSKASAAWVSIGGNPGRARLRALLPPAILESLARRR